MNEPGLVELTRKKMAIPGNEPADVSAARLNALRRQVASQLKPVLRERDGRTYSRKSLVKH